MKLSFSNRLTLMTRVAPPTTAAPHDASPPLSASAQAAQKAQAKRLGDMQNALVQLRAMPSAKGSAKQAASERAAMLKQQLDLMKQMMIGVAPAQARGMAAQLKAIARELAALAKTLSGEGGTGTAPAMATVGAGESATPAIAATGSAERTESARSDEEQAAAKTTKGADEAGNTDIAPPAAGSAPGIAAYTAQDALKARGTTNGSAGNGPESAVDSSLRKALAEAGMALRVCLALLKSKLGASRKDAKDIKDAEAQLKDMERSMAKAESPHTSVSAGQPAITPGSEAAESTTDSPSVSAMDPAMAIGNLAATGGSISVSA